MSNSLTKKQATQLGKGLLARMAGQGWKLRVWDNAGWHYAVETKHLSVREYLYYGVRFRFSCFLYCGTMSNVSWSSEPNKSVKQALRDARARLSTFNEALANANKVYV